MRRESLSEPELRVLHTLAAHGPLTYRELADLGGWKSTNGPHAIAYRLRRLGLVCSDRATARSLRLAPDVVVTPKWIGRFEAVA